MAHIKEPKGVDFIIQSEPLTDEARREISAFIQAYKAQAARKIPQRTTGKTSRKPALNVDFMGEQGQTLTPEDEQTISDFFKASGAKQAVDLL